MNRVNLGAKELQCFFGTHLVYPVPKIVHLIDFISDSHETAGRRQERSLDDTQSLHNQPLHGLWQGTLLGLRLATQEASAEVVYVHLYDASAHAEVQVGAHPVDSHP